MKIRNRYSRLAAIIGSVAIVSLAPAIPVAAEPNCAVTALVTCRNGAWEDYGYASQAECQEWEEQFCELSIPPPGQAPRCKVTAPLGDPFWSVCD